jgi:hypothetical protein
VCDLKPCDRLYSQFRLRSHVVSCAPMLNNTSGGMKTADGILSE